MQLFRKLFSRWIQFVYHCFDRVVINGYLDFFRAEHHVVYFFHDVLKEPVITKTVLRRRTADYVRWIEAYARNRKIPLIWVPRDAKGRPLKHEEVVAPALQRVRRTQRFGVYYVLMTKERGRSFRSIQLRHATQDPNYRMIRPEFLHYRHYYFHIYDAILGNMVLRVASFIPFTVCAYINGHEFMARRLRAQKRCFHQQDNAFTAVGDPKALQRAANALSARIIRQRLNYWAFTLGPKFSAKERLACNGLARSWSIQQLEYCVNVVFKRNWPIRHIFERCYELSLCELYGRSDQPDLRPPHQPAFPRQIADRGREH